MKAIILAAGMGTRIQNYTSGMPKSLIKIHGISILEHTLRNLLQLGIHDIEIVVGYEKQAIIEAIHTMGLPGNFSTTYNNKYASTGTAYSLLKGIEKSIGGDVLILEADVMFEAALLQLLTEALTSKDMILVEKFYPGLDGSFVDLDAEKFVVDWTHKNMRKEGAPIEHLFKTININKFSENFVHNILFPKLMDNYNSISSSNQSLESIFHEIVKESPSQIRALDNNKRFKWQEVDDIEDLRLAQLQFREDMPHFLTNSIPL